MPYFSSPDATVNKKTGLLAPSLVSGGNLGYGMSLPYFINLAPNYDLTLTPTFLSKQGLLGEVDWRQRLSNGIYNIRRSESTRSSLAYFRPFPMARETRDCEARSKAAATFFLMTCGSSAGTAHG